MYSKERGFSRPAAQPIGGRGPAYRQPRREKMQGPLNYSGNAIVDGEERPLGQQVEEAGYSGGVEGPIPTFAHVPRVSELGASVRPWGDGGYGAEALFADAATDAAAETGTETVLEGVAETVAETAAVAEVSSVSLRPQTAGRVHTPLFDASRFPFGHGIGFEELLILGLILFFLREGSECADRGDLDETVILLGLLLLLG